MCFCPQNHGLIDIIQLLWRALPLSNAFKMLSSSDAVVCFRNWFLGIEAIKPHSLQPSLSVKEDWVYNPVASGQIKVCLPTNPDQDMVRRVGGGVSTFQFSSMKNYSEVPILKELTAQKTAGHDTLSWVIK